MVHVPSHSLSEYIQIKRFYETLYELLVMVDANVCVCLRRSGHSSSLQSSLFGFLAVRPISLYSSPR